MDTLIDPATTLVIVTFTSCWMAAKMLLSRVAVNCSVQDGSVSGVVASNWHTLIEHVLCACGKSMNIDKQHCRLAWLGTCLWCRIECTCAQRAKAEHRYSKLLAGVHMCTVACDHITSQCVIMHHGQSIYPGTLSSCEGIHSGVVRQQGCGDHRRHHTSV